MQLTIEGTTLGGEALDLRERRVDPDGLGAALYDEPSPYDLSCPTPGPLHERVGVVTEGMAIERRTALALAARSRGLSAPQDARIERLQEELAAVEIPRAPPVPDAPPAEDVQRLRERVAELRGKTQALDAIDRDTVDRDPADVREQLRTAAGRLAELETERAARAQASQRLREVRDARERRLRLEDRLANTRRAARAHLAERLSSEVATALEALGYGTEDPADVAPDALALSILHVARVVAPVVLRVDRFDDPTAAATWLDAPVIQL